jgi:hypothetical protein
VELLHQEVHQVRQADPALAGVEDGVLRNGARVDAGRDRGNAFRCQQLRVVADGLLVGVAGLCDLPLPFGVPHQPAAELQPLPAGVGCEERAVPVHAGEAELVVGRGPLTGGVEPGQRTSGGFAGQAALGQQRHGCAFAEQVDSGGDAQDAAADDGDVLGGGGGHEFSLSLDFGHG